MKKLFKAFIAIVLFFTVTEASAQISVGGGLWYGTDNASLGISANGKYDIDETWAGAASFTYFLGKEYYNLSVLDFDANYNITEIENIGSLYGIGGLSVSFWKFDLGGGTIDLGDYGSYDTSYSESNIGLNLGLGLNVVSNENFAIAPEIKYTISNGGYLRIGAKILFGL